MSELSGLELQKAACEALGWAYCGSGMDYGGVYTEPFWTDPQGNNHDVLPAIESDPAVSEPMFLEWCAKNHHQWRISSTPHRLGFACTVWLGNEGEPMPPIFADGATPSEARARAIVAASQPLR